MTVGATLIDQDPTAQQRSQLAVMQSGSRGNANSVVLIVTFMLSHTDAVLRHGNPN